ncbi:glycoside hydrolase family 43 protein [Mobilitalea sibirica]|uniref:Glycoside hydrolase family 43 protein n=1 Tax=Mobilitalea sibirica TaxID=1462919 RepID=A0A8J7H330_9FIRM|nr:glycoside hydrolase family 43 protein [Mobilitalea sibirica]MBH1941130.1 glycoside hydrolase family 43 protein [Mobilitalea sibirica]
MKERAKNPILPGFYPDPSICRVEDDYYLVTSTFAYFPGVPIFHSKDLIHWKQIGNILDREEQINLTKAEHSGGIFAPTIRYHKGTFYMITTNVSHGGNFIVTATDPAGPWSNPYFIKGAEGIDPSLFFDDDGKCYYTGTRERREGAKYFGDNEIWLQELDLTTMSLVGESYALWHGALRDVVWPEGPHLYKKDGKYYLLIAEAGTGHEHAVTIAASDSLTEPFQGCKYNPILTHRHLGQNYPIVNVGHGDMVETQLGEWYMVVLASRIYGGYYRNLGRETFLVPLIWEQGWPVINPGIGLLEDTVQIPDLTPAPVDEIPVREDFDGEHLPYRFVYLRNPNWENYSLSKRKGYLRMKLVPEKITDLVSPSYVGIRQTGMSFVFEAKMEFQAKLRDEEAGVVLLQSNRFHYRFVSTIKDGIKVLQLIRCLKGEEDVLTQVHNEDLSRKQELLWLRIKADKQELCFTYSYDGKNYHILKEGVDARLLSTDVAGGFVGNTMGVYCSSNGVQSENYADFDWVEYRNLP